MNFAIESGFVTTEDAVAIVRLEGHSGSQVEVRGASISLVAEKAAQSEPYFVPRSLVGGSNGDCG
jgi:hypothetical protein